jgi:hypothetical protein
MRRKRLAAVIVGFSAVVILLLVFGLGRNHPEGRTRLGEAIRHVRLKLDWATDHVTGPWNPFAKRVSLCAPFSAVRWRDSVPEVEVKGVWYELLSLDDIPAEEIVRYCKKTFGGIWRKRFEEDLVIVLQGMGRPGHADADTGPLTVRRLDTGETLVLPDVAWTNANRDRILRKALDAWIANGRKSDPRDETVAIPGQ